MTEHQLLRRVEAALAEALEAQGFSIDGTFAYQSQPGEQGGIYEVHVDISEIAQHLVREGIVK